MGITFKEAIIISLFCLIAFTGILKSCEYIDNKCTIANKGNSEAIRFCRGY